MPHHRSATTAARLTSLSHCTTRAQKFLLCFPSTDHHCRMPPCMAALPCVCVTVRLGGWWAAQVTRSQIGRSLRCAVWGAVWQLMAWWQCANSQCCDLGTDDVGAGRELPQQIENSRLERGRRAHTDGEREGLIRRPERGRVNGSR
jgi:hypothetical protein